MMQNRNASRKPLKTLTLSSTYLTKPLISLRSTALWCRPDFETSTETTVMFWSLS